MCARCACAHAPQASRQIERKRKNRRCVSVPANSCYAMSNLVIEAPRQAKDHRKDSCEAVNPFIIDWCAQFCGKQTTRRFHCVRWFVIDRLPISMPIFETWKEFFYLLIFWRCRCHRKRINQSQSTRQTAHDTMLRMCIVTVWLHRPKLIGSQKIIWRI